MSGTSSHPSASAGYRPDIDGLRAVAVAAVVGFHVDSTLVPGGFAGVDIFFVISGYLISSIIVHGLARGSFRLADFYVRRVRRIFPALAVVLAATWMLGWFVLLDDEYAQLGTHVAAGAGFVSNLALWNESGYFDRASEFKPLLHLWSLGVEEQFYLIWPLTMMLLWRRSAGLLYGTLAIATLSFALNVATVGRAPAFAFYMPMTRLWELLIGAMLAFAAGSPSSTRAANLAATAGLALLACSLGFLTGDRFPGWQALLPTTGAALVIWAGERAWLNRFVLSHPAVVLVGLISYPLYLWHWPLLTFVRIVAADQPAGRLTAAAAALSVLLAFLTYRYIEQPIRQAPMGQAGRPLLVSVVSCLLVVAGAGLFVRAGATTLPRFPDRVQSLAQFGYQYAPAYREGRCYLLEDQTAAGFGAECVDPPSAGGAPLVFLWGDSHAAHLYPGLRSLQETSSFRIAQFTSARCPPLLEASVEQASCRNTNEFVVEQIRRLDPEIVLLAARWSLYPDLSHLDEMVNVLRTTAAQRIVVVGPAPYWRNRLPRMLFNHFRRFPFQALPARLTTGFDTWLAPLDRELRARAARLGVDYVSILDVLCNESGCLAKTGDGPQELTAWDESHLTAAGSQFVMRAIAAQLFAERSRPHTK